MLCIVLLFRITIGFRDFSRTSFLIVSYHLRGLQLSFIFSNSLQDFNPHPTLGSIAPTSTLIRPSNALSFTLTAISPALTQLQPTIALSFTVTASSHGSSCRCNRNSFIRHSRPHHRRVVHLSDSIWLKVGISNSTIIRPYIPPSKIVLRPSPNGSVTPC